MSEIINNYYGEFEVSGRCSGECCKHFGIMGLTLEEIKSPRRDHTADIEIIRDMLIPLTIEQIEEINKQGEHSYKVDEIGKIFTCKHYDRATHDCKIYDTRPDMCRIYPFCRDGKCEHKGCTYKVVNKSEERINTLYSEITSDIDKQKEGA